MADRLQRGHAESRSDTVREAVFTDRAPKAIGPYSQGIKAGGFLFCSGQAGVDPATGKLVEGGIEAQTRQTLRNIQAVLEAAGTTMAHAVRSGVFLSDMADFKAMNAVYAEFFPAEGHPPARTTVQAAKLPLGALVEIDLVALL
jgi:2-iminobutanoate/2-iminopropanoate deaminase